jgi:hypothetical protein
MCPGAGTGRPDELNAKAAETLLSRLLCAHHPAHPLPSHRTVRHDVGNRDTNCLSHARQARIKVGAAGVNRDAKRDPGPAHVEHFRGQAGSDPSVIRGKTWAGKSTANQNDARKLDMAHDPVPNLTRLDAERRDSAQQLDDIRLPIRRHSPAGPGVDAGQQMLARVWLPGDNRF